MSTNFGANCDKTNVCNNSRVQCKKSVFDSLIIVTTGPDVVANLTIKKIESDNLTVSWTAPGNNPDNPCLANGYLVTFELLKLNERCQNDSELTTSQNTTNTTLTIGGLKANSTYRVNVTSTNEAGHGEIVSRIVTTGETEPQAAPVIDANRNATDSSLTFFWNPVPCVSRYQYDFRRDDGKTMNTNFTSSNFISFVGLSPCTSYSFSVKAFTSENASSRWTSRISQRTSGAGRKCEGKKRVEFFLKRGVLSVTGRYIALVWSYTIITTPMSPISKICSGCVHTIDF